MGGDAGDLPDSGDGGGGGESASGRLGVGELRRLVGKMRTRSGRGSVVLGVVGED